jgi:methylenetetrahydrofolate dehydrogenase (NADP+)/methenyltetrahydrofolate cyclohydrolase
MTGLLLDGKALASALEPPLAARIGKLRAGGHDAPTLAVLFAGEDRRAAANARLKAEACRRTGLECRLIAVAAAADTRWVLAEIDRLNGDAGVQGIFLQYPLGGRVDERRCGDRIAAGKDVDCAGRASLGLLAGGGGGFAVAAAEGILVLLARHGIGVAGRQALVVGTGAALALPMALMLLRADATLTICHADDRRLPEMVGRADLVVGAAGRPQHVKARWIKNGAVVVDLGFHRLPRASLGGTAALAEAPVGDVEMTADLARRCGAWTPVPGGAGPMTVAVLLAHVVEAAERAR